MTAASGQLDTVIVALATPASTGSISWPAAATLVAAGIAGFIAWRQYVTAKTKLRLDIFDKRFAVFKAAEDLVYAVQADPSCPVKVLQDYNAAITQAVFLFAADVNDHLDCLRRSAIELRSVNSQLAHSAALRKEVRDSLVQRDAALLAEFSRAPANTRQVFAPYLQFHQVTEQPWWRRWLTRR